MTVTIDPNIKKKRIFINKYGKQCTEEEMFGQMGGNVGRDRGANQDEQTEETTD